MIWLQFWLQSTEEVKTDLPFIVNHGNLNLTSVRQLLTKSKVRLEYLILVCFLTLLEACNISSTKTHVWKFLELIMRYTILFSWYFLFSPHICLSKEMFIAAKILLLLPVSVWLIILPLLVLSCFLPLLFSNKCRTWENRLNMCCQSSLPLVFGCLYRENS